MNAEDPSSSKACRGRWGGLLGVAALTGCLGASAIIGYYVGRIRGGAGTLSALGVQQKLPLDAYFSYPSFSEIENTKSRLRALCLEFLSDVRSRHDLSALGPIRTAYHRSPSYAVDPQAAIQELRAGIAQFKGSEPEMLVVQELLCLLKREQMLKGWLDVYLAALARHPTDPLILKYAADAEAIGKAQRREAELHEALDLLHRLRPLVPETAPSLATTEQASAKSTRAAARIEKFLQ